MRKTLSVLATAVLVLQSMGTSLVYAQAVTETEGGEPTSAMDIVADVFAPESNDDGDNDESPVIEEVAVEETVAEPEVAEEEAAEEPEEVSLGKAFTTEQSWTRYSTNGLEVTAVAPL
jgi:hypothetical protein